VNINKKLPKEKHIKKDFSTEITVVDEDEMRAMTE
jgi:hypothetical protein